MQLSDILPWKSRSSVIQRSRRSGRLKVEQLEERTTPTAGINLAGSLGTATSFNVPEGLTQIVPLSLVTQPAAGTIVNYNATSSNSQVTTWVDTSTQALDLNVSGKDASGTAFSGDIILQLFADESPAAVQRIVQLTDQGFYNGLDFFRVISSFAAQAGDPNNNGTGGSTLPNFNDQFASDLSFNSPGMLAMANSGPDTNNSQFFITPDGVPLASEPTSLNFKYDIFGQVVSGFSTLSEIFSTPVTTNPVTGEANSYPVTKVVINTATIIDDPAVAVLKISESSVFKGTATATINVTANDGSGASSASFGVNFIAPTSNNPAFLGTIANQTTYANTPVTFQIPATDIEGDQLTYVVTDPSNFGVSTPPPNVTVNIDQATGQVTVTPNANFTGTVDMLIGVRDQTLRPESGNSSPSLNDQKQFDTHEVTLTVLPNDGTGDPVINPITLPTVADGTNLSFTAFGVAPSIGGTSTALTYGLGTGAPSGASINPQTGQVTWTPAQTNGQAPGVYNIPVVATETNNPQALGSETFTVTVGPSSMDQGSGLATRATVANGLAHGPRHYLNFVTAAYNQYLGRAPDQTGLNYWVNLMENAGLTDEQLEANFLSSQEYIQDHGGTASASWVQSLYVTLFNRTPAQSEITYWVAQLNAGQTPYQVALGFSTSQENETQIVQADYQHYLGRSGTGAEVQYWVNLFESGSRNEQVAAGFIASREYFQKNGNNIVDWLYADYRQVLQREPDSTGLQYWENQLQ